MDTHVSRLLNSASQGDGPAGVQLLTELYTELRRLATARMAQERPGQTLQPTALVHEAWLRMIDDEGRAHFTNRAHFFGAAAEAMRRILIDRARRKQAARHGGGQECLDVDDLEIASPAKDDDLLAINDALDQLTVHYPRKAELAKLRFIVGLSIESTADVLGISTATAKRDWTFVKAWLFRAVMQNR
jgi:RNA polymerase sigma factor (TIGR02999 family)